MSRTFTELLSAAMCGKLQFVCCLSRDQLIELREILEGMSAADITLLHTMACGCAAAIPGGSVLPPPLPLPWDPNFPGGGGSSPGGPAQPAPPAGPDYAACAGTLSSIFCSTVGEAMLTAAQAALGAVAIVDFEPASALFITGLIAALEMIDDQCDTGGIQPATVQTLCEKWVGWTKFYDDLNFVLKIALSPVQLLMVWNPFGLAISKCCTGSWTPSSSGLPAPTPVPSPAGSTTASTLGPPPQAPPPPSMTTQGQFALTPTMTTQNSFARPYWMVRPNMTARR
jgi:hypothetical protein